MTPFQNVPLPLLTVTNCVATEARQSLLDDAVIYGEGGSGPSLGSYTHRQVWSDNGLEFGKDFPDPSHIFVTDRYFTDLWNGPPRVFPFVPPEQRQQARPRLLLDRARPIGEKGGTTPFVNRPLTSDQPTLKPHVPTGALR